MTSSLNMLHKLYETSTTTTTAKKKKKKKKKKKRRKRKGGNKKKKPHHPQFAKCPKHPKTWAFGEGSDPVLPVSFFVCLYNVIIFLLL